MPELLATTSSVDLAELKAYEVVNGPIGAQYNDETLAAIQEQLQHVCRLLIAQNAEDEDDIPEFMHYPRPYEIYKYEVEG